jgi:hypothetical protein
MAEEFYTGKSYRLRAGSPMPISNSGDFVLHTFMAEETTVESFVCTQSLPKSSDFRGQGGNLISASFSRLATKDGNTFSGKKVYTPDYVDEDYI